MKLFYANNSVDIHTFTINHGEYVTSYTMDDIIVRFAHFIEIPREIVEMCLWDLVNPDCEDTENRFGKTNLLNARSRWTPSEWSLLLELAHFMNFVDLSERKDGENMLSRVLHFSNLNSGTHFTWMHSIC